MGQAAPSKPSFHSSLARKNGEIPKYELD